MSVAPVIWQEVECGGYAADLLVWEELAEVAEGPVLELGCGTGRVALRLARLGHDVWAVDATADFVAALASCAASEGLSLHAVEADARRLSLDREFALILAPMQLFQVLGGPADRAAALESAAACLRFGGRLAAAIVDGVPEGLDTGPSPPPDIREADGWVYSSLPLGARVAEGRLQVRRLRQAVSPDGALSEDEHLEHLEILDAATLEAEGLAAGLRPAGRLEVPSSDGHVGSTVVVLERA